MSSLRKIPIGVQRDKKATKELLYTISVIKDMYPRSEDI